MTVVLVFVDEDCMTERIQSRLQSKEHLEHLYKCRCVDRPVRHF